MEARGGGGGMEGKVKEEDGERKEWREGGGKIKEGR